MDVWDELEGGNNNNDSDNGQHQALEKGKYYFGMYETVRVVAAGVCASPCKTLNSVMRGSAGTQPAYLLALLLCFDRPDVRVSARALDEANWRCVSTTAVG